jgi:hypothetical protein
MMPVRRGNRCNTVPLRQSIVRAMARARRGANGPRTGFSVTRRGFAYFGIAIGAERDHGNGRRR